LAHCYKTLYGRNQLMFVFGLQKVQFLRCLSQFPEWKLLSRQILFLTRKKFYKIGASFLPRRRRRRRQPSSLVQSGRVETNRTTEKSEKRSSLKLKTRPEQL
jgi:hypothetical protein